MSAYAEQAIFSLLSLNATVKQLVGKNIFQGVAHEGTETEWIVFNRVSDLRVSSHEGFDGLSNMRYQISVWSIDQAKRTAMSDAVLTALDGILTTVSGTEVHFQHQTDMDVMEEGPPKRYGRHIDFFLWI